MLRNNRIFSGRVKSVPRGRIGSTAVRLSEIGCRSSPDTTTDPPGRARPPIHAFPAVSGVTSEDVGGRNKSGHRGLKVVHSSAEPLYSCSMELNRTAVDWFRPSTSSKQPIVKIVPLGVVSVDESDLPGPRPMLDIPLALLCGENIVVLFGVNEKLQAVLLCKSVCRALQMFPHSSSQIHRGPDVKRAVTTVRHNVDPSSHRRQDSRMTMRWQRRRGWPEQLRPRGSREGGSRKPLARRSFRKGVPGPEPL